jgi:HTH-type transcriptional regulator / antitoxin HigA
MSEDTVMVRPVRSERDYEDALERIGQLMTAHPGTPAGDELDVLSTLVEAYEAEHHPIEAPDPIALVEFAMEQRGADRTELEPLIGTRGRVSEVLNRKRPLTIAMIRNLKEKWGLPAEVLVQPYQLCRPSSRKVLKRRLSKRRAA